MRVRVAIRREQKGRSDQWRARCSDDECDQLPEAANKTSALIVGQLHVNNAHAGVGDLVVR